MRLKADGRSKNMKAISITGAILGLIIIAASVAGVGLVPIAKALSQIGWTGLSAVCLIHLG